MADKKVVLRVGLVMADIRNCTVGEVESITGFTRESVQEALDEMEAQGLVGSVRNPGKKVHYTVSTENRNPLTRRLADLASQAVRDQE